VRKAGDEEKRLIAESGRHYVDLAHRYLYNDAESQNKRACGFLGQD
jgi:hypothetical protein